jgi:predicted ATP-dependent endonuclease of OLD family
MKLHSLKIQNFRAIEIAHLDFTDNLSKPKSVNLIVGPNGSGKTSILDAILIVMRTLENPSVPHLREALEFSVSQLVRGEGKQAQIDFEYAIDTKEARAINEVFQVLNKRPPFSFQGNESPLKYPDCVTWVYPTLKWDEQNQFSFFFKGSVNVLEARRFMLQGLSKNLIQPNLFERVGGVCYLEQRRSLQMLKNYSLQAHTDKLNQDDVLSRLNIYYRKHLTWNQEKYGESYWQKIQRLFNQICSPAELIRLESGPHSDTLIIKKNHKEYDLFQMSSGEHQILRILVSLVAETAVNSIVLIDEIELHLHPAWQRKLLQALRADQSNNQYIITTHSPFIKQLFFEDEIIELGELGEQL